MNSYTNIVTNMITNFDLIPNSDFMTDDNIIITYMTDV